MTIKNCFFDSVFYAITMFCCIIFVFSKWILCLDPVKDNKVMILHLNEVHHEYILQTGSGLLTLDSFPTGYKQYKKKNISPLTIEEDFAGSSYTETVFLSDTDPEATPIHYTRLQYDFFDYPVYGFYDNDGHMQYRLFAKEIIGESTVSGFIPAYISLFGTKLCIDYDLNDDFVEYGQEPFGSIEEADPPSTLTYGLSRLYGHRGVFYRETNNEREYFVYGHYPNGENGFFLADDSGSMIIGTFPVKIEK